MRRVGFLSGLAEGDTVRLAGRADWLVCIEDCFPAEAELELTLAVSDAAPGLDPMTDRLFEAARSELPVVVTAWSSFALFYEPRYWLKIDPPDDVGPALES